MSCIDTFCGTVISMEKIPYKLGAYTWEYLKRGWIAVALVSVSVIIPIMFAHNL
jgi:hypothetical protein